MRSCYRISGLFKREIQLPASDVMDTLLVIVGLNFMKAGYLYRI
jgi:hypothetical protein